MWETIEEKIEESLWNKAWDYRRLLWEKFWVTRQDQIKTILQEDLPSKNNKDEKVS